MGYIMNGSKMGGSQATYVQNVEKVQNVNGGGVNGKSNGIGLGGHGDGTYGFNRGFEDLVVTAMVRDPRFALDYADVLLPSYFEGSMNQVLARLVSDYVKDRKEVPGIEFLRQRLVEYGNDRRWAEGKGVMYLGHLERLLNMELKGIEDVRDRVVKFGRTQALKLAIAQCLPLLEQGRVEDYGQIRQAIEEALHVGMETTDRGIQFRDVAYNLGDVARKSSLYGNQARISTGFPSLDGCTRGGMGCGELWVVLAPTKTGKSTMLVNMAVRALLEGERVFFYTFELREEDVSLRLASRLTGVKTQDIVDGSVDYDTNIRNIVEDESYFHIKYFSPGRVGVDAIRSHMSRQAVEDGITPSLVFVDYADKFVKTGHSDYEMMGEIYDQLIGLGNDFGVPVVTASQTNRSADPSGVIGMDDVSDSYRKVANADFVVSLNRTNEERMLNVMRLWVAGNRRGEDRLLIPVRMDYDICCMREIDMETYDEIMRHYRQNK